MRYGVSIKLWVFALVVASSVLFLQTEVEAIHSQQTLTPSGPGNVQWTIGPSDFKVTAGSKIIIPIKVTPSDNTEISCLSCFGGFGKGNDFGKKGIGNFEWKPSDDYTPGVYTFVLSASVNGGSVAPQYSIQIEVEPKLLWVSKSKKVPGETGETLGATLVTNGGGDGVNFTCTDCEYINTLGTVLIKKQGSQSAFIELEAKKGNTNMPPGTYGITIQARRNHPFDAIDTKIDFVVKSDNDPTDANPIEEPPSSASSTSSTTDTSNVTVDPFQDDNYKGLITDCALDGSCRDSNDLLEVITKVGNTLFGIIGGIALVMFVYGGFTMLMSAGNAEKVKQGHGILVAAVIGLVIAFSAYLFINFVLESLTVSQEFRGVKQ